LRVLQSIYHEVEHLYYPGETKTEDGLKYLGNPGEIRAFARQFTFLYHHHYPNSIFDLKKMQALAESYRDKRAIFYFIQFANHEKQKEYRERADVAQIHKEVTSLTERFCNDLHLQRMIRQNRDQ